MSTTLQGNYKQIDFKTLATINAALHDKKIDKYELEKIEQAAKCNKNEGKYTEGEKKLIQNLKQVIKDNNVINNFEIAKFNPKNSSVTFDLTIEKNINSPDKMVGKLTPAKQDNSPPKLPESFKVNSTNFNLTQQKSLSNGVSYSQYNLNPVISKKTIRVVGFNPKVVDFSIQYGRGIKGVKHFKGISKQKGFIACVNGITMSGYFPQGDIKGIDSKGNISVYQLKDNMTAANCRYSIGIKKNGDIEIMRGGLDGKQEKRSNPNNPDDYKYFINGAALLFNEKDNFNKSEDFYKEFMGYFKITNRDLKVLKNSGLEDKVIDSLKPFINKKYTEKEFKNLLNNTLKLSNKSRKIIDKKIKFISRHDNRIIANMRPKSEEPRTAMGITKDGKAVFVTFGAGDKHGTGTSGYEMYQALKAMGVVKAVMLDGGGAPFMTTKDDGKDINTIPDINQGYHINSSFLVITEKK